MSYAEFEEFFEENIQEVQKKTEYVTLTMGRIDISGDSASISYDTNEYIDSEIDDSHLYCYNCDDTDMNYSNIFDHVISCGGFDEDEVIEEARIIEGRRSDQMRRILRPTSTITRNRSNEFLNDDN